MQHTAPIYFAFPGDLDTPSGGYHYDRRLIAALRQLGITVQPISLPHCSLTMEQASKALVYETLAALPDQSIVIFDGLAFGVLDDVAEKEASRLRLIALCHTVRPCVSVCGTRCTR